MLGTPDDNRPRARLVAHYLPQFHPIPENDAWWGPGFTEWTNVARARPRFRGHRQPNIPGELGFYDLRLSETRQAQAQLAADHGIAAFCYWHYWFAGRRLLERPFQEVLEGGCPSLPFCLGWANQSWTGHWHGAPRRMLIEQTYPGAADARAHVQALLSAFRDPRYLKVDGRPVFLVFRPTELARSDELIEIWRSEVRAAGLPGLHMVAVSLDPAWNPEDHGYDAAVIWSHALFATKVRRPVIRARRFLHRVPLLGAAETRWARTPLHVYRYAEVARGFFCDEQLPYESYPSVLPNWDNTPRAGVAGSVLTDASPQAFKEVLRAAVARVEHLPEQHRLIFIRSWNEWAEGNYLEPDERYGRGWLEACRDAVLAGPVPTGVAATGGAAPVGPC